MRNLLTPALAGLALATAMPTMAMAQSAPAAMSADATRLDITVTGKATRVPDIAVINAGVQTRALTASDALAQNAQRIDAMLDALEDLGIERRDIQTQRINLNAQYDYRDRETPKLTGYVANNSLTIRFRDIEQAGRILDILVAEGANQLNGPTLMIDDPEEALDEARQDAIAKGMARAKLYAAAMGKRVARVVVVQEGGGPINRPRPPMAMAEADIVTTGSRTQIVAGEQDLAVTLSMSFDLE
ncbi:SIMPL domain-containing protein [Sphingomicrobium sediminis]|uniref:SIMPL domain-containing protein n=1 Tax=Sphingomicrobium sediminis TaxID=2950949 RepID=A0A9X2EKF7_9SPHN|nr:SIMPL domain-containing protein [Sphingomicrobium sediminis]MCM8558481.1 SIMPL domain-containing protein [Sphingomicrobium sediminis]